MKNIFYLAVLGLVLFSTSCNPIRNLICEKCGEDLNHTIYVFYESDYSEYDDAITFLDLIKNHDSLLVEHEIKAFPLAENDDMLIAIEKNPSFEYFVFSENIASYEELPLKKEPQVYSDLALLAGTFSNSIYESDVAKTFVVYLPSDCEVEVSEKEMEIFPESHFIDLEDGKWSLHWTFFSCCDYEYSFYAKDDQDNPIYSSEPIAKNSVSFTESDLGAYGIEPDIQYFFEVKAAYNNTANTKKKLLSFRK